MGLDGVDPPGVVAQCEGLADPPLEDELLVELAQPRTLRTEVDRELPGIGNRAAADQGQPRRTGQGRQPVVNAIPGDPRAQIAQRAGREPPRDQAEHALEDLGRQIVKRIGTADQVEEVGHIPAIHRHAGHHLLGQDVKATMRHAQLLDVPLDHGPGQGGRLQQVARRLGDQPALADAVHHVTGPAYPLQAAGDVARRLHLADQIDLSHVDAELERGRRDHAFERAALERFFGRSGAPRGSGCRDGAESRPGTA